MSATNQDIFKLTCLLKNIKIRLCARAESGLKQLLALVTSDEIVLHYTYGELTPTIKRIPWLTDPAKQIEAISFDPTATWLLLAAHDGDLYILPALSLSDPKAKVDCKWSPSDLTHFPRAPPGDACPTGLVWWQTLDSNQNAIVGYASGGLGAVSLADGRCLAACAVAEPVGALYLCQDANLDVVSLLVRTAGGLQYRLQLESASAGLLWPPEAAQEGRSRLHSLRQMGADKLASIRQRFVESLVESRSGSGKDSDTASESSESGSVGPELLHCHCETLFAPQHARSRYWFSAFYKPTALLTVHALDVETAPIFVHKLMQGTERLLLTDRFIYTVNSGANLVSVVSSQLSECRMEGDTKFNSDALVAEFQLDGESILEIYKLTDLSSTKHRKSRDENRKQTQWILPKTVDDITIKKPKIDTCVVVTTCSIYKITIAQSPIKKFVQLVTESNNIERAERISFIFGLNLQHLLEACGDLMLSNRSFHSGIILYKQAKVHILKRVLKLAISADCRTLLKFIHLCLSASRVDMSMATKIHIGNLAVMAYTELILRYGGAARISNTKDFMSFLRHEEFYDQILAVNVACQAGHWYIVSLLAKSRGLQPEVVSAFGQILQSARAPRPNDRDFLFALSEACLTQSLLVQPHASREVFNFVRQNIRSFSCDVLLRFAKQLDPSQPCCLSLVSRLVGACKYSSGFDTTIESLSSDQPDQGVVIIKDLIETYLFVLIELVSKPLDEFRVELLDRVEFEANPPFGNTFDKLPPLQPLNCGYEHAAVVRNSHLYTMGVSSAGCLGLGPLLTHSSPPKLVQTLTDLKVKVLSVACGKRHTLALTDWGLFAFGSNSYGQLGLGFFVNESPYPQLVASLAGEAIVAVASGQYHSLALNSNGEVFTWGWGIHGQLGHSTCENLYQPKRLAFGSKVRQITGGHAHSLILTDEGEVFGFGSNVFGQLENCTLAGNKTTKPIRIAVLDGRAEAICTNYFHNVATSGGEVYAWGATPQEVRLEQAKEKGGTGEKSDWRSSVRIFRASEGRVEQVAVGYRHSVLLHHGQILWGRGKEEELSSPILHDRSNIQVYNQRFVQVACGLDYTMAIDHSGKLVAWGSPTMAQTILGRAADEERGANDGKVIIFRNTRRVVKFPNTGESVSAESYPIEVPGVPSMAITFNPADQRLILARSVKPFAILSVENKIPSLVGQAKQLSKNQSPLGYLQSVPQLKFGCKTLHFVLETYHGCYDHETILGKCLDSDNYQAAGKVAMLEGHFGDSLAFLLVAFKKYMDCGGVDLDSIFYNKEMYENVREKEQDFVDFVVKNMQEDFNNSGNFINNSNFELSTSSSLDSMRQWGEEEHQGGCESPCELAEGDVRQTVTHYVRALSEQPISSVSKLVSSEKRTNNANFEIEIKDENTRKVIENASKLIEFYIRKIYVSENHILMQNVLMKCIEFWLSNSLPVPILENVLLKNMDKYFYPLSILLFCKNFTNDEEFVKDEKKSDSAGFLKQFSTKFCLQLCSMVLDNVNKA